MHLKEMDPSMLIAFIVKDHDDWVDWLRRIDEVRSAGSPEIALRNLHFLPSEAD